MKYISDLKEKKYIWWSLLKGILEYKFIMAPKMYFMLIRITKSIIKKRNNIPEVDSWINTSLKCGCRMCLSIIFMPVNIFRNESLYAANNKIHLIIDDILVIIDHGIDMQDLTIKFLDTRIMNLEDTSKT